MRVRYGAAGATLYQDTDLYLAAFDASGNDLTQRRFIRAQFLRQTERQIQKTAVDRPDFQAKVARSRCSGLSFGTDVAGIVLSAGVTGHAINWHLDFLFNGVDLRITRFM